MILGQPIWLVLLIPLGVALWRWRMPSRLLAVLRGCTLVLMVLAMCSPSVRLPSRAGTVVVVADRSLSMPPGAEAAELEAINIVQSKKGAADRLAVVSFGRAAAVELAPQGGRFTGFVNDVDAEGSNLAEALATAASLIPADSPGRILVLSDGKFTGRAPADAVSRAATRDVAVDYRTLARDAANDLAILHVDAPATVAPGESFMVTAWVRQPVQQTVRYALARGGAEIASGERAMPSGVSRLTFRDRAPKSGVCQYLVRVVSDSKDPVPENNQAKFMVGIRGPKPLLCVTRSADSGLVRLLAAGGLDVVARAPEACTWDLGALAQHSAVLIENTPAEELGEAGMQHVATWVADAGAGLMMTGGRSAYGPGGYFKSPLEPIMPVSMELRKEHRKLALAVVVALDRSGSMSLPAEGGKSKMDLANLATAEVLELLSSMDEFGCVAVDSSAHVIAPLAAVSDKDPIRRRILRIDSLGGGIFIYEALAAAARQMQSAQAGTRHIILFADAADSEEPGDYRRLLEECRKAGITVSVIGLGLPTDSDAGLLRDIAKRGDGRISFTNKAKELPRLFAQDTFVAARSAFLDQPVGVRMTAGGTALASRAFGAVPSIGGYNLCYLRPGANLAAITTDEYKAPVVAAWQAGAGRVLCYTGEADGQFTGPIARWDQLGQFFTSLARWTAGESKELPANMLLVQELRDGACVVRLHLDPDRRELAFTAMPTVMLLRGRPGAAPQSRKVDMQWESPDTLAVSAQLSGQETVLASVEIPGVGRYAMAPVCLPYSLEFRPSDAAQGAAALQRLARATGGEERISLETIWDDLPAKPRLIDLAPWLLAAAMVLLMLEVFERRTWWLSVRRPGAARAAGAEETAARPWWRGWFPRRKKAAAPAVAGTAPQESAALAPSAQPSRPASAAVDKPRPAAGEPPPSEESMSDALRQARRRARGRTDGRS